MELTWLEDFIEIVATRNFPTAAAARNISQSALSRRIKLLEAWLGIELLDRSTYPVRLTGAGNIVLSRAQGLVRQQTSPPARSPLGRRPSKRQQRSRSGRFGRYAHDA